MRILLSATIVGLLLCFQIRAGECLQPTFKQALKRADTVFVGTVLDVSDVKQVTYVDGFGSLYKIRMRVDEYWKGVENKEINFMIYWGGTEQQWSFDLMKKGDRFLIFAQKGVKGDELNVVDCSLTDKVENAKDNLARLGKGKKFK